MLHAAETGIPPEVAFEEARRYAREIVPGFSATVYFGFGTRAAKALSRLLFRVHVGHIDEALHRIDPKAPRKNAPAAKGIGLNPLGKADAGAAGAMVEKGAQAVARLMRHRNAYLEPEAPVVGSEV